MGENASVRTALAHGDRAPADLVDQLSSAQHAHPPAFVSVFASSRFALGDVLRQLRAVWPTTVVVGASSSGEFTEAGERGQAISAWALWGDFEVRAAMAHGLTGSPEAAIQGLAGSLNERIPTHPHRVGILLLDAMSGRGEEATLLAATLLDDGDAIRLVGGAAGDDLAMQHTWVGVNEDASEDAVVLAFLHGKHPFGIGVEHGHRATSRPLSVTRAAGNIVHELEGRPAWDVWREETRALATSAGIDVDALEGDALARFFFTHSASLASGAEIKVRAPLKRLDDGALSFACGVPEGSVVRVTDSDVGAQLASARAAAMQAREQLGEHPAAGALVFDCICRKLILGDGFSGAIETISAALGDVPVAGFETYGEIALDVTDHSGFHNSTTVVLAVAQ